MNRFPLYIFLSIFIFNLGLCTLSAQAIPSDRVLSIKELPKYLKPDVKAKLKKSGKLSTEKLAAHYRQKFSEGFFYDYKTFYERLAVYNNTYSRQASHESRAMDHTGKYTGPTKWSLPFNYQNGEEVNAYALRHLARQHKMVDVALHYFNADKDPKFISYFEDQMRSLNVALAAGKYEKIEDGNGVYEVFRSGYRILNWLWIHNMFLNEEEYSDKDQLQTVTTLLQHAAHLYERNDKFRSGNHQTRGMSALAMLAIIFSDVEGADLWLERAMQRLGEHLDKEINEDGFQFERSVHYHMSDINNYFYVYQLAKINKVAINADWEQKLRTLFSTLTKIAYPTKDAPVLQDDTNIPWAEQNEISKVMTLGYLLFEDPKFGYFATDNVEPDMYWFLQKSQLAALENIEQEKPTMGSLSFPDTHYYIMREGWETDDHMMIISAGLDIDKPDHQHGDMLGIQAMANSQVILPNYQVRYSLTDFDLFKNSMVKNVALVDSELQGKQWTSNKGGSGFGKFKKLPNPQVITWKTNDTFDLFVGSHDGFEDIGVGYSRQVIYLRNDFWIVKDNFSSDAVHEYKQVWQGHYTQEAGANLLRSTFPDASGSDILQLNSIDLATQQGSRGKNWTVAVKKGEKEFNFLTVIFPYKGYDNRIAEGENSPSLKDWKLNTSSWEIQGEQAVSLSKKQEDYFFNIQALKRDKLNIQLSATADVFVELNDDTLKLTLLSDAKKSITVFQGEKELTTAKNKNVNPGDIIVLKLSN